MEIRKNIDSAIWDGFLAGFPDFNPFAQSSAWAEVLLSEGKEVERLAVYDGVEMVAAALVVYEKLPFGMKYAFSPKGVVSSKYQVASSKNEEILNILTEYLKKQGCVFWRLEPNFNLKSSILNLKLLKVKDINPSNTLLLNLDKDYNELLLAMHPKTRYNIGLAERKNLRVENKKDLKIFLDLMKKTGDRDNFRLHFENHYREVLNSPNVYQITIFSEKISVTVGIFFGFNQTFTYLYGASDYDYRNLMAPYLVQNEGIKLGKSLGFKKYDFFGIAPITKSETGEWNYDDKHQYSGVTRFKLGFGGQYFSAPGTFEIVISYKVYKVIKFIKLVRSLFKK